MHAEISAAVGLLTETHEPSQTADLRDLTSYGQKIHLGHNPPFMPPLDDSTARAHPVFRDTEPAPRDQYSYPEGTAKCCPCPDDSAPHGNARHIRLAHVVRSARRTVSPWT